MRLHPPKVKSFLFFMSLDLGTKIIAYTHSLLFIYLALSPTIESYLSGRYSAMHGFFMELSFTSYGIFSLTLLYGTMRVNPIHMAPWVLLNVLFVLMLMFRLLVWVTLYGISQSYLVSLIASHALIVVVQTYSSVVVYSYYLKLKEQPSHSFPIRDSSIA